MDTEMMAGEFQLWLEAHADRAEAALDGLTAIESAIVQLPPAQAQAITDLTNLLARALARD